MVGRRERSGSRQNASARETRVAGSAGSSFGGWLGFEPAVLEDPRDADPAAEEGRGVEPARVVPAGDVRRVEELLARELADPGPVGGRDPGADPPQEPGDVHDRRLDHPLPVVQVGVAEDRPDDRLDRVRLLVESLERSAGRGARAASGRSTTRASSTKNEAMERVLEAEPAGVLPAELAALRRTPA